MLTIVLVAGIDLDTRRVIDEPYHPPDEGEEQAVAMPLHADLDVFLRGYLSCDGGLRDDRCVRMFSSMIRFVKKVSI